MLQVIISGETEYNGLCRVANEREMAEEEYVKCNNAPESGWYLSSWSNIVPVAYTNENGIREDTINGVLITRPQIGKIPYLTVPVTDENADLESVKSTALETCNSNMRCAGYQIDWESIFADGKAVHYFDGTLSDDGFWIDGSYGYIKTSKQTTCDAIMCDTGYRVENHTCVQCDRGKYNNENYDASGHDRDCTEADVNHYVDSIG